MNILKSVAVSLAFVASIGAADAAVVSGTFNAHGYDVVNIHVDSTSNVEFFFTNGYGDATFGLFNSTGAHLVTNDDANGSLNPHLTQWLAAGNYSLLVSYCCSSVNALAGSSFAGSDGFNIGSYWFGGSATLGSVATYLDQFQYASVAGAPYEFRLTNAGVGSADVPEPGSLALFGASIAALAMVRRRKQQG